MTREENAVFAIEPAERSRRMVRPFSIAQLSAVNVLAAGVVLAIVGLFVYQLYHTTAQRYLQQRVQTLASEVTYALAMAIQASAAEVERAATDTGMVEALRARDALGIANAELRLSKRFENALRVRVLQPGASGAEIGAFPRLGYADLDMVHIAEANGRSPLVEAHLFGTEEAHIDIMKPVHADDAGKQGLLGHVLVSFNADLIRQAIDHISIPIGYLEIRQRTAEQGAVVVLAKRGDAALAAQAAQHVAQLAGTRWELAFAPPVAEQGEVSWRSVMLSLVIAGGFAFLALIAYGNYRLLSRALQNDLETLIDVVRDARAGKPPQAEYPLRLKEFRGTVDVLSTSEHAAEPPATTPIPTPTKETMQFTSVEPAYLSSFQKPEEADRSNYTSSAESSMELPSSIFRAYDIRGVVGETLTEDIVYEIGRAIGSEAYARGQQSVAVARDGRLSGPALSEALSNGIRAAGREVIDIGRVPTPVLYFATHYLNTGSGVMVTGSHNPAQYNGLKMVLKGETLAEEDIQALRRRIETNDYTHGSGSSRQQDIVADYVHTITGDIRLVRPLKVVVDCGNGVAGDLAPRLLRALGCEVIELYCEVDGHFPNHHPDPSQPENLKDLIASVLTNKADLGLAFDGDGDRVALIDGKGGIIWPDRQMMLYAKDVLSRNPGARIIFDVKCSRHLAKFITKHGGQPLMWKTGHSLIKRKMKETGALLAGEMSGHIFFKERWFGFDDGLYTAARLLEILAADARPVGEIFAGLPDAINTPELRVDLQEGEQTVFMARLLELAQFKGAVLTTIDGVRADYEDGWGLVRASNTTPSLILRFEANTEAALKRIQNDFRAVMLKVSPALKLPF